MAYGLIGEMIKRSSYIPYSIYLGGLQLLTVAILLHMCSGVTSTPRASTMSIILHISGA